MPKRSPRRKCIAELGPGDDAPGDGPGDLPDDERGALSLESPGQRFVLRADIGMARIEEKPRMMLDVAYLPVDGGAVRVDIEDGEENANAFHPAVQHFGFLRFRDGGDRPIRGGEDSIWVFGCFAFRIAEENSRAERYR